MGNPARAMHGQFTATAQRHAAHRGDHRHGCIAQAQHRVLQLLFFRQDALGAELHEDRHQRLQVGASREHIVGRPDHQALVALLRQIDGLQQTFSHRRADQMQLGGDRSNQHFAVLRPDTQVLVLEQLGAGLQRRHRAFAEQALGESLALLMRQLGTRLEPTFGRTPGARRAVHAGVVGDRAFEDPGRQRSAAQSLAGSDVFADPFGHLFPARRLPELERALLGSEAPAHRKVDLARRVGNIPQMHSDIVEAVAQDGPEELRLRIGRFAQQLEPVGGRLLQDARDDLVGLLAAGHIVAAGEVQALDVAADLLVETAAGFLAQ